MSRGFLIPALLGNGYIQANWFQCTANHFYYFTFLVLSTFDIEAIRSFAQQISIGFVFKLRTAHYMETRVLAVKYHGQVDNYRMSVKIRDMPLITILNVSEKYLLKRYLPFLTALFCRNGRQGYQK